MLILLLICAASILVDLQVLISSVTNVIDLILNMTIYNNIIHIMQANQIDINIYIYIYNII